MRANTTAAVIPAIRVAARRRRRPRVAAPVSPRPPRAPGAGPCRAVLVFARRPPGCMRSLIRRPPVVCVGSGVASRRSRTARPARRSAGREHQEADIPGDLGRVCVTSPDPGHRRRRSTAVDPQPPCGGRDDPADEHSEQHALGRGRPGRPARRSAGAQPTSRNGSPAPTSGALRQEPVRPNRADRPGQVGDLARAGGEPHHAERDANGGGQPRAQRVRGTARAGSGCSALTCSSVVKSSERTWFVPRRA